MATIQQGALTTTATTADQVITSFTPTGSTSWKSAVVVGYYTTWSATEANLGTVYMEQGGVDKFEGRIQNTDLDTVAGVIVIPWGDGLVFSGAEVVRWVVTPASTTSMRWTGSFFGQG
jgi:hypothetical protein